jgi:hypothetical protein
MNSRKITDRGDYSQVVAEWSHDRPWGDDEEAP